MKLLIVLTGLFLSTIAYSQNKLKCTANVNEVSVEMETGSFLDETKIAQFTFTAIQDLDDPTTDRLVLGILDNSNGTRVSSEHKIVDKGQEAKLNFVLENGLYLSIVCKE